MENAHLKNCSTPTPKHRSTPRSTASAPKSGAKGSAKGSSKRKLPFHKNDDQHEHGRDHEHDPLEGLQDFQGDATEFMSPRSAITWRMMSQAWVMTRRTHSARLTGSCAHPRVNDSWKNGSLSRHNITSVNQWLSQTKLGKNEKKALDLAVAELLAAAGKLDAGGWLHTSGQCHRSGVGLNGIIWRPN